MTWGAEHDTLGIELTEVPSQSTPSLRNGAVWCARRHTSICFVAVSGVASVAKDKIRGDFAIGEIWPKLSDRLAFAFVFGRLS